MAFIVTRGLAAHQRTQALADARESAIRDNYQGHVERLENQIILLKVDPIQAATYAAPQVEEDFTQALLGDDSPAADAAWAERIEQSRS